MHGHVEGEVWRQKFGREVRGGGHGVAEEDKPRGIRGVPGGESKGAAGAEEADAVLGGRGRVSMYVHVILYCACGVCVWGWGGRLPFRAACESGMVWYMIFETT